MSGRIVVTALIAAAVSLICAGSTEFGADLLVDSLRIQSRSPSGKERAVVLLSGNMSRLRTAIEMHKRTGLPVLISGASTSDYEAILRSAGAAAVLVENASKDTEQNAAFTACVVKEKGLEPVYLVTDAVHMKRALGWFEYYGIQATPAIADPEKTEVSMSTKSPRTFAWSRSAAALHELGGLAELELGRLLQRRIACPSSAPPEVSHDASPDEAVHIRP